MSRLKTALSGDAALMDNVAYRKDTGSAGMIDMSLAGSLTDYQPDFGALVSNTAYTPRNIIPILLEAPRGYQKLTNPEKWVAVLKSLMETQSKTITCLRTGLDVEYSDRPVGGAGHMISDPVDVKEQMSTPTHVWDERYGKAIQKFWMSHIRNMIAEPVTKQPGIMNVTNELTDMLNDVFTFTMLYIEPDPLRKYAIEAWMCTQMSPTNSGTIEVQMDPTAASTVPEISIEFKCVPINNKGVLELAQRILDEINYINAGPQNRPAFIDSVDANVAKGEKGYVENIAEAQQTGLGVD